MTSGVPGRGQRARTRLPGGRRSRAPSDRAARSGRSPRPGGMNASGGTSPRVGMLPADQRLEADDPVRPEVDDRLVVDAQLVALECPPEVVLEVEPLAATGRSSTGRTARTARPDRPWPGPWRSRPRARARRASTRPGSPRAMPIEALMNQSRPLERERGPELGRDDLRDPPRLVLVRDVVEDDPELVAAEPGDGVAGSQARREPLADRDQQAVADGVADALVDDLEAVEVEHDHGDGSGVVRADARERVGDAVRQQLAVRQPGRRVVEGAALPRRRGAARCRGRSRPAGRTGSGPPTSRCAERAGQARSTPGR